MAGLDATTAAVAAANHGRLSRAGLLARGVPVWQVDAWVRIGVLIVDRPGQYLVAGAPQSELQALLGAVAAASAAIARARSAADGSPEGGWAAVAADEAALALAGAEGLTLSEPFAVAVGRGRRIRMSGIRAVAVDVQAEHRVVVHGVPAMSVERAFIGWSSRAETEAFRVAFHDLRRRAQLDVRELRRMLSALPSGRDVRAMRRLLDSGVLIGESPPEHELAGIWRPGDPRPDRQVWVRHAGRDYRLDLCFLDSRLAPEYDGDSHGFEHRRQDDADRTIALAAERILRVPVTAKQLRRPDALRRQLLGLHAQRIADGVPRLEPGVPPVWWDGL